MKNALVPLLSLVLALALQACSRSESPDAADEAAPATPETLGLSTLEGLVHYDQLGRLPANAAIHVEVRDVTDGSEDGPVIASTQAGVSGASSPYRFELVYDARLIQPQSSYLLAAELRLDGRVLNDSAGSVDPFAVDDIELAFKPSARVPAVPSESIQLVTYSLQGIKWQLSELGGEPVSAGSAAALPYIEVDPGETRFSGSTGCNDYSGSYELNGTRVSFGQTMATQRACADGMELESRYLDTLANVATWRMEDTELVFGDAERAELARFTAILDP